MLIKKAVIFTILLVFMLNSASAQYYYDQSFDFGFLSVGGVDDILYLYGIYSGWIDFFLSLLIFLGLTQAVFENTHLSLSVLNKAPYSLKHCLLDCLWLCHLG